MRTITENKTLNLSLSEDQQGIVNAERKRNRAVERRDRKADQIRRLKEDAELFGRPTTTEEIRLLELELQDDNELAAQCERELQDAKDAPARREQEAKEAAVIIRDMTILDQQIDAWTKSGAPLMAKADDLIERVVSVGMVNKGGWHTFKPAYREAQTLLERLRFWARTTSERGDGETFAERLARYRRIGEPKAVPKPPTFTGTYQRSVPLSKHARENAAARLKMTPSGVETSR